jgi:hypothetical protein
MERVDCPCEMAGVVRPFLRRKVLHRTDLMESMNPFAGSNLIRITSSNCHTRFGWVVLTILLLSSTISNISAAARHIHVRGRILAPDGEPVGGQMVKLFKSRRGLTIGKFTSGGQIAEATRTTADSSGFFEIDIPRDRAFDNYFLRFWDPESFDAVQYIAPEDREITRDLKRNEALRIDIQLARNPAWEEVSRRLAVIGEDSPQGRILRQMGIPENETVGDGPGGPRNEWWYHSRGVVYFFRDGEPAGFRNFEPVRAIDESPEN